MIDVVIETFIVPLSKELGTDIILKATLVLSAAAALTYCFKGASSATRHAIWSGAFVILFVVPGVSLLFPSWRIDGYTVPAQSIGVGSRVDGVAPNSTPFENAVKNTGQTPLQVQNEVAVSGFGEGRVDGRPAATARADMVIAAAVILWMCGSLVLLLRLVVHVARVGRITRRASVDNWQEIRGLAAPLIKSLGIEKPLRIVMSDEVTIPFASGVFKPAIIFPSDANRWPVERKQSVLLHELAHVARSDYLSHIVTEIVQALYWPNPLVWLASRQKATERERACDDFALREGTPCCDYANHILDVARLQVEPCVPVGAVTMTAKEGLVDRIRYVLDDGLDRSPISSDRMFLVSIAVFFISIPLGMLDVTASKWAIPSVEQLAAELGNAEDSRTRSRAAWWLGEHENRSGVAALTEALHDRSAEVRVASAWALGEIKDADAIGPLSEALELDEDILVREMAALALGEIESPSAVDALVDASDRNAELGGAIVWALGEIARRGSGHAATARKDLFDDMGLRPWDNEQVWTGDLGGHYPRSQNVSLLLEELNSEDHGARRDAALSLGFLGVQRDYDSTVESERVVDALLESMSDPVPEVRAAAVWSLDEINPSRWSDGW